MAAAGAWWWKCVAALQSAFWFFLLPALCRPYWAHAWALAPGPFASQVMLNLMSQSLYVIYGLVMWPIYRGSYPFFEQYKISDKPWAWQSKEREVRDAFWALSRRSAKLCSFNLLVLVPMLLAVKFFVLGDNVSFGDSDWPSYGTLLRDNVAMTLVHEFGFYWWYSSPS